METPKIHYSVQRVLSGAAHDLVLFDVGSIDQVVAAHHGSTPDIWLADPDQYETNGRLHRDSESSRLLAYACKTHVVYATDGCNSCYRRVERPLEKLSESELEQFAHDNELRPAFLRQLALLCGK